VIKICSNEGRDDCQQLKPKGTESFFGTTVITATILFIISILFSRVMVNVLVCVLRVVFFRALSIQPKIPEISVGSSNGTDHFGLVRPEHLGPALKVVHSDRSGYFGRSNRNVPFHLPKLLSPVPLTRTSSFHWKVKYCGKAMTSQIV